MKLLERKIINLQRSDKKYTNIKKDLITFYWTRKDPQILSKIIENFSSDGDTLFDPFLGSAPILFSLDESKKNIRFIGSEINEMPISFIKFNLEKLSDIQLEEIRGKFLNFYKKYSQLYLYKNSLTHKEMLISRIILDRDEGEFTPKKFIFEENEKKIIDKKSKNLFNELSMIYKNRSQKFAKLRKNDDIELIPNSRIAIKKGMKMSELFNPINFHILKAYFSEFDNDKSMISLLASVLHLCRLTDLKSQSQFPFWVPKKDVVERNILIMLKKRIDKIYKEKLENTLNLNLVKSFKSLKQKENSIYILNKPSQEITKKDLPDNTVDLVITDPPYFDQVAYSEYLKIWEFFCGYKSLLKGELIHSNREEDQSDKESYLKNLYLCFSVVSKKMKDRAIAIIFFKDSKPENIYLFIKQMQNCGLQFVKTCHVQKKKYTYKQNTTQNTTVSGECLFFFKKVDINSKKIIDYEQSDLDKGALRVELEGLILNFIKEMRSKKTEVGLGELYDSGLILQLYKKGLLGNIKSSKEITRILDENFKKSNNRDYQIG